MNQRSEMGCALTAAGFRDWYDRLGWRFPVPRVSTLLLVPLERRNVTIPPFSGSILRSATQFESISNAKIRDVLLKGPARPHPGSLLDSEPETPMTSSPGAASKHLVAEVGLSIGRAVREKTQPSQNGSVASQSRGITQ